jgi:anti-repressor protein
MNGLIKANSQIQMTTVEIAELTGKRHDHVMRDTKAMLSELYEEQDLPKFGGIYRDAYNREKPCFRLPKKDVLCLVAGYSVKLRMKIINRLEELEGGAVINEAPDVTMARAVLLAQETMERQQKQIQQLKTENKTMKPKAFFADCVNASTDGCLVRELAKILAQKGIINTGQNRLYRELRSRGYVIKKPGLDYNLPTQRSIDLKVMFISENIDIRSDGTTRLDRTTRITGKGQRYFVELFAKEMGKTPELIS